MGRAFADAYASSRAVFDEADAALGEPLSRTCFDGPAEALARTEVTQPALLTASVAALHALRDMGMPAPAAGAGHSLGEYSAHVAAGTLPFADAVRAVRARGRFMQEAVPAGQGAMVAVIGLSADEVAAACASASEDGGVAAPANFNAPGQVVIAGHAQTVARAVERARALGARKVVPLAVSAPFHCSLMAPAAQRLRPVLDAIAFRDPAFPVYSNVTAARLDEAEAARDALVEQVTAPVRWAESIERMVADGTSTFVEVGPGRVLNGLVRRIAPQSTVLSVSDPASAEAALRALEAAS